MTLSRKPQEPQERGRTVTPKEAQQEPTPHPAGGEEEDTAPPPQKETLHTYTGTTRDGGQQLKHTRLATAEREKRRRDRQSKKGNTKSVA